MPVHVVMTLRSGVTLVALEALGSRVAFVALESLRSGFALVATGRQQTSRLPSRGLP